jgi:hypothetical protein
MPDATTEEPFGTVNVNVAPLTVMSAAIYNRGAPPSVNSVDTSFSTEITTENDP